MMSFREAKHPTESPLEYFERKTEIFRLWGEEHNDAQLIKKVMLTAPRHWEYILMTNYPTTLADFQQRLSAMAVPLCHDPFQPAPRSAPAAAPAQNPFRRGAFRRPMRASAHLIGQAPKLPTPSPRYERDDTVVSKGQTPAMRGMRPCAHCGSPHHWDNDCPKREKKSAKAHFASLSADELRAEADYLEDYEEYLHETGANSLEPVTEEFEALEVTDQSETPGNIPQVETEDLGGLPNLGGSAISQSLITSPISSTTQSSNSMPPPISLFKPVSTLKVSISTCLRTGSILPITTLKPKMPRPPGCAFLGCSAVIAQANALSIHSNPIEITVDTGSEITLISHDALSSMDLPPKVKQGQQVKLIEVTGSSSVTGYVNIPVFFNTDSGSIRLDLEAYVVKGMSTPFILGNDFADQFSISILRESDQTRLQFSEAKWCTSVKTSAVDPYTDVEGKSFKVRVHKSTPKSSKTTPMTRKINKSNKKKKRNTTDFKSEVRAAKNISIPPSHSILVPVDLDFKGHDFIYVEKVMRYNTNPENFYGSPDSIISSDRPFLHISNFSSEVVKVCKGDVLGITHNPSNWLDRASKYSPTQLEELEKHAQFVKSLSKNMETSSTPVEPDPKLSEPAVGGPKTAENL
ncbi:hypothetical protein SISSUDRAFT_1101501 [Sistotremastrum suecicum HHB10207 ss-3]|uniref:CCHC-type domain-containing protein n=1 Tax=Sistotremastrum suecicum HHB10207 ss-3 TaxID=1314776 RepID=A0A165WT35_9AGAM|nr:hypothetical protein SISSUDRAFT_1101501 [Sistotremastrum suecicum HHB10207 ss-3]